MSTVLSVLINNLGKAASYNPDIEVKPDVILWPDKERQWEPVVKRLQNELSHLFVLGDYKPDERTGPAIWLRCAIAGKTAGVELEADKTPVLYLPGVSRQDLRRVEEVTSREELKPLAELQYRGAFWTQLNAKDWTLMAFLKSEQGGLALDVAQDRATAQALQLALYRLVDSEVDLLKGKRLDKDFFNTLLIDSGDPVRDLLQWIDQGEAFVASRGETQWQAFVEIIKSQFAFDPASDGVLSAAAHLAAHEGPWLSVWERFCEAPDFYPGIPDQIRKTPMPGDMFFNAIGWPQWNEQQETELRRSLLTLEKVSPVQARNFISQWEKQHQERRELVWARLGQAKLAQSLEWLAILAQATATPLEGGHVADLAEKYQTFGWKADDAVIQALKYVEGDEAFQAVSVAIRSMYTDWAEKGARHLQKVVEDESYPGHTDDARKLPNYVSGEVVFFIDGLRFDVGKRFSEVLQEKGYDIQLGSEWAALPSVTATAKPAVSPVKDLISGKPGSQSFEPCVVETEQALSSYNFQKLLDAKNWQKLNKSETGDSSGNAWCECGDIDHQGLETVFNNLR